MNKEQKAILNRALRTDRIKKYKTIIFGILIFLALGSPILFFSIPQEIDNTKTITGTTLKLRATPSSYVTNDGTATVSGVTVADDLCLVYLRRFPNNDSIHFLQKPFLAQQKSTSPLQYG